MIKIEAAKAEEAQAIKRVLSETWVDTYGPFLSKQTIQKATSVWHAPKHLIAQIQNPEIFFYLAKDERKSVLGLITARQIDHETLVIYRLYVHPQHQRKGIGRRLLEASVSAYPGVKKLQLEVEEQNQKGLAFYRKNGFIETGRKEEKIETERLIVIVMEKQLA